MSTIVQRGFKARDARVRGGVDVAATLAPAGAIAAAGALYGADLRAFLVLGVPLLALGFGARVVGRGSRGALLLLVATLALTGGLIGRSPLALLGGALFAVAGLRSAWGVNRGRARRRVWSVRVGAALGTLTVLLFVVYPSILVIDYLAKPRQAIDREALGLPHRAVTFPAADGVRLAGWYAPGTNGAAVVVVHGGGGDREGAITHARMLFGAGYGVLLYDARGRGESGGHANAFGWEWDRDVHGAVDFLRRAGVSRIGLLGLSTGAEAVVTEAATDPRVAAVVSDGLQGRTPADAGELSLGNRLSIAPAFIVAAAEIRLIRGDHEPPPLLRLVHQLAETRPLLMIATEDFERDFDRAYARGTSAQLWELPGTPHTKGLARHPRAYRARVLSLFNRALL